MKKKAFAFTAVFISCLIIFSFIFNEYKTYSLTSERNNRLVIPEAKIDAAFAVTDLTQEAVDSNNIVCTFTRIDYNNPIICGHNYRTMRKLSNTSVGDYIHIYLNGEYSKYIVITSELACIVSNGEDFQGVSGINFIDNALNGVLRLYTCYGNDRWIVIAKPVTD